MVQPVPGAGGDPFPQVLYGLEQFDLNNEYDPATSTFIPRRSGVYSFTATVTFDSNVSGAVSVGLAIRANNSPIITDRETFSFGDGSIDASGLVRLRAGDRVQVFFTISGVAGGNIEAGVGTRFEGARIG
ncbi:C1q-like domain-containing protein [Paenibacillus sp. YIM B09110]|uniref:C1q-like domain-containing protein n=1 Tax=Paenibacillus sp. YIM B09110 TaxID=3126102 RepID=UPI00301E220D